MAKQRIINTRLWTDSFIQELSLEEKLLFIYLLTNSHTNISGIYECSFRTMEFETGINKDLLTQSLSRLTQSGKVAIFDGWVVLKNFSRHQNSNPSILKGVEREKLSIPASVLEKASGFLSSYPACTQTGTPNLNLNSNLNPTGEVFSSKEFFENSEKQEELIAHLSEEKGILPDIARAEIKKFISYWTEKNASGTKQRWQMEKVFEVKRRLATWFSKAQEFGEKKSNLKFSPSYDFSNAGTNN